MKNGPKLFTFSSLQNQWNINRIINSNFNIFIKNDNSNGYAKFPGNTMIFNTLKSYFSRRI